MHTNASKAGQVGAIFLGGVHVLWSALVLLGWAQPLVNFSMWAHMVEKGITIKPFEFGAAITVIIVASCVGYCVGYALSTIWNKVHRA
ncbi:MAG: Uncharacterized protein G01um10148_988 [Parcubacteria group bacterium Gr01-1014_8]|nr:MAG: Uncharacterized protein G01um10148_988 [Parcubacteria group bacterium Gr01-1014_8]